MQSLRFTGLQVYNCDILFSTYKTNVMVRVYRFTGLQLKHVLIGEHRELQVYWFTFKAPFFIYSYKMSYLKLIDSPEKLWFTGLQVYNCHIFKSHLLGRY